MVPGVASDRLLEALLRVGRSSDLSQLAASVAREVHALVEADTVIFCDFRLADGGAEAEVYPDQPEEWRHEYLSRHVRLGYQNPVLSGLVSEAGDRVLSWASTDEEVAGTELFRDYFGPLDVQAQAGFALPAPVGARTLVLVNRSGGPFTDEECETLEGLRTHLANFSRLVDWERRGERRLPVRTGATEDESRLLAAVERIAASTDLEDFARVVCREIARLVPAIWVSYNETNLVTRRAATYVWPEVGGPTDADVLSVLGRYARQNPLVRHVSEHPDSEVRTWHDLADENFWRSRLYTRYYAPLGVRSQAAFGLPGAPGVVTAIAVNRDGAAFTPQERQLMNRLRPFLSTMYRVVYERETAAALNDSRSQAGWESVLVTDDDLVLESSPAAVRVGRSLGLDLQVGGTVRGSAVWSQARSARTPNGPSVRRAAPVRLLHQDTTVDLLALINPVGPHLLQLRQRRTATPEMIGQLGLTPRQSEVAALLADGWSNADIAASLHISPATVRKHLEGVYAALGVTSRAAAAVEIARLLR